MAPATTVAGSGVDVVRRHPYRPGVGEGVEIRGVQAGVGAPRDGGDHRVMPAIVGGGERVPLVEDRERIAWLRCGVPPGDGRPRTQALVGDVERPRAEGTGDRAPHVPQVDDRRVAPPEQVAIASRNALQRPLQRKAGNRELRALVGEGGNAAGKSLRPVEQANDCRSEDGGDGERRQQLDERKAGRHSPRGWPLPLPTA
jgi:hypothetical protein